MLSNIIDWSGRNRFLVLLATLSITLWGVFAVLRTPIDALPDLSDVQVIVTVLSPSAGCGLRNINRRVRR